MYCNIIYYSMNNNRFSVSLHILTLLATAGDELLSSEYIAGSININPVLVRKELSNLRKHGMIETREGKAGGSILAKPAKQILLSDVYAAVRQVPLLGQNKNEPNPSCPVGKQINKHLDDLYTDVEKTLMQKLGKTSLFDFSKQFN